MRIYKDYPLPYKPKYYVVGITHVDLAWKRNRDELSEMEEIFIIRLLDALDIYPSLTYVLEQSYHLREIKRRRPELFERLKKHVQNGRIEILGGMVSTMETNIPCGESLIRNQLLGLQWVRDNFDVDVETAYLIDTFGLHAQMPQILHQFGFKHLLANRFGANHYQDVFYAQGLDGNQVLIAGRDVYSAYVRPEHIFFEFTQSWEDIDSLFEKAASATGAGPFLVVPYTENEILVSLRPIHHVDLKNQETGKSDWVFATPREFFQALETSGKVFPAIHGDLNPEFTGTYSNRIVLRLRNRSVENKLLEAEHWACLLDVSDWQTAMEEAWWTMGYNHFHDVFTGSQPTKVFRGVMDNFNVVENVALRLLDQVQMKLSSQVGRKSDHIVVMNRLPFARSEVFTIHLAENEQTEGIEKILENGLETPFEVAGEELHVFGHIPASGVQSFEVIRGRNDHQNTKKNLISISKGHIENDTIRLDCDNVTGISKLIWKATNQILWQNAGDFLVLQQDDGSFQIEDPRSSEVPAAAGKIQLFTTDTSSIGERLLLSGEFPSLVWAGENPVRWEAEFLLIPGNCVVQMRIRILWDAERARLRLKIASPLNTGEGIFEIPFGVVKRRSYGIRGNSRGEWPAQRFVAIEDGKYGLALVNRGVPGVEVGAGTLWTTLLRAPYAEYAGMIPDDTSSQHGKHEFDFLLLPYQGSWVESDVIQWAQAFNAPFHVFWGGTTVSTQSWMHLEPGNVVLSSVKAALDRSEEIIVRLYETAGVPSIAHVWMRDAAQAWMSNLKEEKFEAVTCLAGAMKVPLRPFEIITLRVRLNNL